MLPLTLLKQITAPDRLVIVQDPEMRITENTCERCSPMTYNIKLLNSIKRPVVRKGIVRWEVDRKVKRRWILDHLIKDGKWQIHKACAERMGAGIHSEANLPHINHLFTFSGSRKMLDSLTKQQIPKCKRKTEAQIQAQARKRKKAQDWAISRNIFRAYIASTRTPNGKRTGRIKYNFPSRFKRIRTKPTPCQSDPHQAVGGAFREVVNTMVDQGM